MTTIKPVGIDQYFKTHKVRHVATGNEFHVYQTKHVVAKVPRSLEEFTAMAQEMMRYGEMQHFLQGQQIDPKKNRDRCIQGYKVAKEKAGGLVVPFEMPDWLEFNERWLIFGSEYHVSREAVVQTRVDGNDILDARLESALKNGDYATVSQILGDTIILLNQLISRGTFGPDIRIENLAYFDGSLKFTDCALLGFPKKYVGAYLENTQTAQRGFRLWKEFILANCRHHDRPTAEKIVRGFQVDYSRICNPRHVRINFGREKPVRVPDVFPIAI